jgi:predicted ArsR family transcriptional regulator
VEPAASAGLGDVAALTALEEPTRRRLYAVVADAGGPVGREEAAAAVGISRSLAAYHLDLLVERGLLEVSFARPPGRVGPGAGRPAKLYRRASREFSLRTPPRDYRLLAELLVLAAEADESGAVRATIEHEAFVLGERLGAAGGTLEQALRERGYEPILGDPGVLRLRNCPFEAVAERCPAVVCGINLALVRGLLAGLRMEPELATLAPQEERCCVAIGIPSRD